MTKLTLGALTLTVSIAALGTAYAGGHGPVLRWTSAGDALTLDPHSQNEGPTLAMNGQIYERLVNRDPSLALVPELATSWEAIAENVWRFTLREGVTFHQGQAFTAEDVVFSINRAKQEASDFQEQVASITYVIAENDHSVLLITDGPNPILPNELTSLFMMDSDWAAEHDLEQPQDYAAEEENYATRNANGTGPFILEERRQDEFTALVQNADWWGADEFPGNIDRIEYRPITNAATRVAALLSGEVDFVLDPPVQDLERINATEGLSVTTVPQIRTIFFGMDAGIDELRTSDVDGANPFADQRVREAMNMAIDRDAIQRVVMDGRSFPAGMITSPGVLGHTPELDAAPAYDVARAQELMAEAGYGDGFSVRLDCPNNRYINDEAICQAAVAMLARIGINVTLDALPRSQHFPKIQNRVSDFYMLGWGVPTLDSHYVFSYLLESGGSWNATGYSNERVDELTEAMAVETDLEAREMMINEAWENVQAETPYIPLHHQVISWALRDGVNVPIAADDSPRFRFATVE